MLGMESATFHSSKDLALLGSGSSWRKEAMLKLCSNLIKNFIFFFNLGLGVCKKTPCESNIQFRSEKGECIFGVDLLRRGQLCGGDQRPWYSVYGEWECKRTYLSLPFGSISDKTTQDPVWQDCKSF